MYLFILIYLIVSDTVAHIQNQVHKKPYACTCADIVSTRHSQNKLLQLQLQSFTLQQIVLRGIMQCCRLVGTDEFSALIGTVGD